MAAITKNVFSISFPTCIMSAMLCNALVWY